MTPWRGALCVEGETRGRTLAVVIDRRSTSLGVLIAEKELRRNNNIIILGSHSKLSFTEYADAERWEMRDRIFADLADSVRCDVYIRSWMLMPDGRPRPTFDGAKYCGGFASSLPVFIYFDETVGY